MPDSPTASRDIGPPRAWPSLALLACPACHAELAGAEPGLRCAGCGLVWAEFDGWLDFRAGEVASGDWSERQQSMEGWYADLLASPEAARRCYEHDFEPLAATLAGLGGVVLDVGGGNGVARRYLPAGAAYVDVDPSVLWLGEEWIASAPELFDARTPITFVLGVGEALPIRSGAVDAVLSLYSINHASDPGRVIAEASRVLRPGGTLLLVSEDIEPQWSDLPMLRDGWEPRRRVAGRKLLSKLPGREWPTAADHVKVTEGDLARWMEGSFDLERRFWAGGYLALEARRAW